MKTGMKKGPKKPLRYKTFKLSNLYVIKPYVLKPYVLKPLRYKTFKL